MVACGWCFREEWWRGKEGEAVVGENRVADSDGGRKVGANSGGGRESKRRGGKGKLAVG